MTPAQLDEIEARADAATPPPWTTDPDDSGFVYKPIQGQEGGGYVITCCSAGEPDAAFIAAARADVPALIADVRRLLDLRCTCDEDVPGGHAPGCVVSLAEERDAAIEAAEAMRADRQADEELLATAEEFIKAVEPKMSLCSHCRTAQPTDDAGSLRAHTLTCSANPVVQERDALRAELDRWRCEVPAPPLPIHGCECRACAVLRRQQQEPRDTELDRRHLRLELAGAAAAVEALERRLADADEARERAKERARREADAERDALVLLLVRAREHVSDSVASARGFPELRDFVAAGEGVLAKIDALASAATARGVKLEAG